MDNEEIKFKISNIHIVSKHLEELKEENPIEYSWEISVETRVHADKDQIIPCVFANIKKVKEKSEYLAKFTVACIFEVEDFDKKILLNEANLYIIPSYFDNALKQIALSTARGVIFSEVQGTYLNNAILPVIFVDQMKETQQTN